MSLGPRKRNQEEPPQDTGRMGFREPCDPPDGRPVISRDVFWQDMSEELEYQHAVEGNPRGANEKPLAYVARIAAIVTGRKGEPLKRMPRGEVVKP